MTPSAEVSPSSQRKGKSPNDYSNLNNGSANDVMNALSMAMANALLDNTGNVLSEGENSSSNVQQVSYSSSTEGVSIWGSNTNERKSELNEDVGNLMSSSRDKEEITRSLTNLESLGSLTDLHNSNRLEKKDIHGRMRKESIDVLLSQITDGECGATASTYSMSENFLMESSQISDSLSSDSSKKNSSYDMFGNTYGFNSSSDSVYLHKDASSIPPDPKISNFSRSTANSLSSNQLNSSQPTLGGQQSKPKVLSHPEYFNLGSNNVDYNRICMMNDNSNGSIKVEESEAGGDEIFMNNQNILSNFRESNLKWAPTYFNQQSQIPLSASSQFNGYDLNHPNSNLFSHYQYPNVEAVNVNPNSPFAGKNLVNTSHQQDFRANDCDSRHPHTPGFHKCSTSQPVILMAVPMQHGPGQVFQPVQMMPMPHIQPNLVPSGHCCYKGVTPFVTPEEATSQQPHKHNKYSKPFCKNPFGGQSQVHPIDSQINFNESENNLQKIEKQIKSKVIDNVSLSSEDTVRFAPTENIASLYHFPQRPPLSSLLGHVRRLSRDQVGCRLLQQSLDEDGPQAASSILREGLPFLAETMIDPFGNYLFQKILEKVTKEERLELVKTVSPRLVNAALNLHGTRSVQKVVEMSVIDKKDLSFPAAEVVTRSLSTAAAKLCIDSHGNHVIQRILQKFPHEYSKFIFDAVANSVGDVARHRHGCCVIQRCLDSPSSFARSNLVKRIVEKALDLMQDAFGNYVVQYVLDVCSDDEASAVCESVVGRVGLLAIQKFSSNVMEKCLDRSSDWVKELYLRELSDPDKIRELMADPFGNYVVQRALAVATHAQAVWLVEAMRPHLQGMRNTAGGRRIISKICRRFPDFNLNTVYNTSRMPSEQQVQCLVPSKQTLYHCNVRPTEFDHAFSSNMGMFYLHQGSVEEEDFTTNS